MAVDSRAVETRSRLTVFDIEQALGFDSTDLSYPNIVNEWLVSAKQAADQYMNRDFDRYQDIPEPVEQGVIAYVREMLFGYLDALSIGSSVGDDDTSTSFNVRSIKVGDQSITYMSSSERTGHADGAFKAGYGTASYEAEKFWSVYRYHPIM